MIAETMNFPFSSQKAFSPSNSGATSLNLGSFSNRSNNPPARGRSLKHLPSPARSRGFARLTAKRATTRSTSHTRSISATTNFRSAGDSSSAAIASCRASMCSKSRSGVRSHCRSSRPPIAERVRSIADSSVPSVPPLRTVRSISRLRQDDGSIIK